MFDLNAAALLNQLAIRDKPTRVDWPVGAGLQGRRRAMLGLALLVCVLTGAAAVPEASSHPVGLVALLTR